MLRFLTCLAAALAVATAAPAGASAGPIDASTVTCKELTESGNSGSDGAYGASVILYWMAGYHATDEQGTVVDFDNLIKEMGQTAEFCSQNPAIGVMTASSKYMGANAPAATPKAIDLSILKCEHVNSSKPDDAEGLGQILMWLSGYHKSTGGTTLIDMDEFSKSAAKIGAYCAKNPDVGLYTASEKFMGEGEDNSEDGSEGDDKSKE